MTGAEYAPPQVSIDGRTTQNNQTNPKLLLQSDGPEIFQRTSIGRPGPSNKHGGWMTTKTIFPTGGCLLPYLLEAVSFVEGTLKFAHKEQLGL